jgi:hypothetical protein
VTDRLSIGVGKPFYFMNATTYVTPKYQVYRGDKACVSTGLVHVFIPGTGMGGLVYSSATIGRPEGAITVGGGWVHAEGDDERGGTAVVMIGGDKRLTRRTSFVTDNYIFAGGAIISGGARWVGRTTSFEAGAMIAGGGGYIGPPGVFFNVIFHPAR